MPTTHGRCRSSVRERLLRSMLPLLTVPLVVQRIPRCCICTTPVDTSGRCSLQGLLRTAIMLGSRSLTHARKARTGAALPSRCSTPAISAARSSSTSPACAWAARPLLRRRNCAAATCGRAALSCRHLSSTSSLPRCVAALGAAPTFFATYALVAAATARSGTVRPVALLQLHAGR